VPVTLASNDLTGISATRAYLDGRLVAASSRSCRYTRPRPCTDETGATVAVPTTGVADGEHVLALGAVDAAGNEKRVTRSTPLKVDNEAPGAPVGLISPAATSQDNTFSASWSLPADNGTPITGARYQVCQNGACGPVGSTPSPTAVSGLSLPTAGPATLRVWLVDQAQHQNPAAAATLTLSYDPPSARTSTQPTTDTPTPIAPPTVITAPPVTTTPVPPAIAKTAAKLKLTTLRRRGRTVTVAGTLTSKASGTVTIRYRALIRGRSRTLTKRIPIVRHAFRTTLKLSPSYAAVRTGTVSVAYAGDRDTKSQTRSATVRLHG
jgi:hypothetical protein